MKILRDDIVRAADADPLELFEQGIRSEETRDRYAQTLRQVTCEFLEDILEGTYEERVAQLVRLARDDPGWTRDLLLSLSRKLRERTELPRNDKDYLNPMSFSNYFGPIKKLFDMNGVAMPWKRIRSTYPALDDMFGSKGWTRQEIARMLKYARDSRDRAIVLLLASSGMRAGALSQLNWGDLTPIYRDGDELTLDPGKGSDVACARLEAYSGSAEGYTAFITPEAFAALQEYARVRSERMGRQAGPDDPVFIVMRYAQRMTKMAIRKRIVGVVKRAGLHGSRGGKMRRVPLVNGFRRFFNKTCRKEITGNSTLASLTKREFMMEHSGLTPLDENYRTDVLELAAEYVKAVPNLTIGDTERLRLSNRAMAEDIKALKAEKDSRIARLERQMRSMEEKVSGIGDRGGSTAD